jgi:Uma2 family endonuclease
MVRSHAPMYDPNALHWTYADYRRLTDEGDYFEFIDGQRFKNPTPTPRHGLVLGSLMSRILPFLKEHCLGTVIHGPLDVVFAEDTVLQPDLIVVLKDHLSRIKEHGLFGAPDLVMEVLLPSTESRDRVEKLAVYARHGVREYWLVDPEKKRIEIFVLEDDQLIKKAEHDSGEARSLAVLPGFAAPLAEVFERP